MNTRILEQLDFYRIRQIISGYAMSEEGKASFDDLLPFTDANIIEKTKTEGFEWQKYLSSSFSQALISWPCVSNSFSLLQVDGAVLDLEQVYALGRFCQSVSHFKQKIIGASSVLPIPSLLGYANDLPLLDVPHSDIFRIIDSSGQIKDLPQIRAIRSSILNIRRDIENLIRHYTTDSNLRDALQSDIPALRSDRQVLAVKANFRGRIKGIVHEVSQSGQTVYIEPEDVVSRGNDLIQEEFRLKQEIRNILRELTKKLSEFYDDFVLANDIMIHLDVVYASARWGIENNCFFAFPCNDLPPLLLQARHPLLANKAVPIDVRFLPNKRVLIITGPNTGGKTVTLKTIALFALLNQSGFPLPAAEGSRLPIFSNIFADIGDDQSLDNSLSTFSGHMKNIAQALQGADDKTLVLLDELGSGTDPQEGGAIGMAVLDYLIDKKSFVLVTTHHGILKNYGYTNSVCINASVEFDETTLAPTYKIMMGVPGESHALDIARRNGLLPEVVDKATSYISNEMTDVSALIKGLTAKHEEIDVLQREIIKKEQIINEKRRDVDLKDLRLRQKEFELRKDGYRSSRLFLDESRKLLENLVRNLREGEITREKTIKVKATIADFTKAIEDEQKLISENENQILEFAQKVYSAEDIDSLPHKKQISSATVGKRKRRKMQQENDAANILGSKQKKLSDLAKIKNQIIPGMEVLIGINQTKGVLIAQAKRGYWQVQVGSLRMTVSEKDMILANNPDSNLKKQYTPSVSVEYASDSESSAQTSAMSFEPVIAEKATFELRLLGMHYEEAMKALERQLDLASLQGLHHFSVIHGKGHGVLQQAVHDMLKNYPGVTSFSFAAPEDGGTGKTYITLG